GAWRAPGPPSTCRSTSCRAGSATRTSCRWSPASASSPRRSRPRTTGSGDGSLAGEGGALTPMMLQYRELKRRYPDYLLLFRLGDFYETFFEDAEVAARLLQITLTSRQGAPMAGIPHHAADGYLARPVRAGRKIAISEQLETPGRTKKLLKRDVVRL